MTTLAGTGVAGFLDGAGASAKFNRPQGLAVDEDGNIFVADSANFRIRRITPGGASVTTYAGTGDPLLTNCATNGTTTVTCSSTAILSVGSGISGPDIPLGATVASITNGTTFELDIAASGSSTGLELTSITEGTRTSATFNFPYDVAFNKDQTKLYVADRGNNRVRQVSNDLPGVPPTLGVVSTFAGTGEEGFDDDPEAGPAGSATFFGPAGLAVDNEDNLYVADEFNHSIRKVTPAGLVSKLAGFSGSPGENNGRADVASFDCPAGLAVDLVNVEGSLVVADTANQLLRRVAIKPIEVDVVLPDPPSTDPFTPISVVIDVDELGLDPNTTYYTRWTTTAAVIPNVQLNGQSFYLFDFPTITTEEETDLTADSALLHAMVNPNGSTTQVVFECSDDPSMTAPVIVTVSPDSYGVVGGPDLAVAAPILQPISAGETVFFRAVATNARGRVNGEVLEFTFPMTEVVTSAATNQTRTEAQLNGSINAMNSPTAVKFEYSTESDLSSPWQVATRAGSGTAGLVNSATPLDAEFDTPQGVAVSGGSVFIADRLNHRIRQVAANGVVTTLAGSTVGIADGFGGAAQFDHPAGLAADGLGNLYVADEHNHRIRKINISTGEVTTLAGSSTAGYVDAVGEAAQFLFPTGVAVDAAGNVYVADTGNHCIRRIAATDQAVTTVAGTGVAGFVEGGAGLGQFSSPRALAVDGSDQIFVADTGNHAVRKITAAGVVSTLAGAPTAGFQDGPGVSARFASPSGISLVGSGMYVVDRDNHRIRLVAADGQTSTAAGSGVAGRVDSPLGMLHPATVAEFDLPSGVASDGADTLWITEEGNHDLRKVYRTGLPSVAVPPNLDGDTLEDVDATIDGLLAGASYYFRAVGSNAIGPIYGDILSFATLTNQQIAVFDGPDDGTPQLVNGQSEVVDFGITPRGEPVVRQFTISNVGQWDLELSSVTVPGGFSVSYAAGPVAPAGAINFEVTLEAAAGGVLAGDIVIASDDPTQLNFTFPISAVVQDRPTVQTLDPTHDGGPTMNALVNPENSTTSVGFEYSTHPEVDGYAISTLAGSVSGYAEGTGTTALFNQPKGLAVDGAGNVYVADTLNHCIRKITPSGVSSLFAGVDGVPDYVDGDAQTARFNAPLDIVINATGTLFVADSNNHRIRAITPTGQVSTYAGFGEANFTDGVGTAARFNMPSGLAIDSAGVLYVADQLNHRIRKVSLTQTVSTLAGTGVGGDLDQPLGVAVSQDGTVYVTEASAHHIKKVTSGGVVSVFAGSTGGFAPGSGTAAQFLNPAGLAVDASGRLLVADSGNNRIRRISTDSAEVTTIAGSGTPVTLDGEGTAAGFAGPCALTVSAAGDVYVGETTGSVIRKIVSTTVVVLIESSLDGALGDTVVSSPVAGLLEGVVYYYRAFASNGGGMSYGDIEPFATVPLSTPFEDWQLAQFGADASDPLIAGADADPSEDGVNNLLKYAFFLDPNATSFEGMPEVSVSGGVATLIYTRALAATDLVYSAECSTNLVDWDPVGVAEQILSSDPDTEEIAVSVPIGPTVKFFRVRVTFQ